MLSFETNWSSLRGYGPAHKSRRWVTGYICAALFLLGTVNTARATLTDEPANQTYNFVTHYRVTIDAPKATVWPILVDLKAWMFEFELANVSGEPGETGEVLRLYKD